MNTLSIFATVNLGALLNGESFKISKPECEKLVKVMAANGEMSEWVDCGTKQSTIDQWNYENDAARQLLKLVEHMFRPYAEKEIEQIFEQVFKGS